jgi:type IV pilus assembly protein PilC
MKQLQYFPPMLVSMLRIGEESGELDKTLEKSADYYEGEVESSIQQMTSFLEPMVILGLAVVIGTIVVSILLPMMKIYDKLSQ